MMNEDDDLERFRLQVATFDWFDRVVDLAKLGEIAQQHSPDGEFRLVDSFAMPEDGDVDGDVRLTISPVLVAWMKWLQDKYGRETAFVVMGKFGELVCVGEGIFSTSELH